MRSRSLALNSWYSRTTSSPGLARPGSRRSTARRAEPSAPGATSCVPDAGLVMYNLHYSHRRDALSRQRPQARDRTRRRTADLGHDDGDQAASRESRRGGRSRPRARPLPASPEGDKGAGLDSPIRVARVDTPVRRGNRNRCEICPKSAIERGRAVRPGWWHVR